jgi:serine protease Do
MKTKLRSVFIPVTLTITLFLASGAFYMSWNLQTRYLDASPNVDGYVSPRSVADLVEQTQESTVTVYCEIDKDSQWQGSGWSITKTVLKKPPSSKFKSLIITNHHVIEECLNNRGKVTIENIAGKTQSASIILWDTKNDLAVLGVSKKIKPLTLSSSSPYSGYWIMAVGTADGYAGSVAFGNVLNSTYEEIFITANISHGNSGGPLVDNEGLVVGTNTFSNKTEQYNISKSLDAMCAKIIKCDGEYYWDYS